MNKTRLIAFATLLQAVPVGAATVDEILAMREAPAGVVIEIIKADGATLRGALPAINAAIARIREKHPALAVAIVSHGREQFALTKASAKKHGALHDGIRALVADDIDVHVCGTHASWYGVSPEDYPEFIDVTHAGPAQINDYINIGYVPLDL